MYIMYSIAQNVSQENWRRFMISVRRSPRLFRIYVTFHIRCIDDKSKASKSHGAKIILLRHVATRIYDET